METKVYAILDAKLEAHSQPFFAQNDAMALRQFEQLANDTQSNVNRYPEDFSMHRVGKWQDHDGKLVPEKTPVKIAEAKDYKHEEITAPAGR